MIILAIDTALSACGAAVLRDGRTVAERVLPMERGHQEALAPLVAEVMHTASLGFDRLDRIAVTVGPGSFTGLRVGLAFAKAMALALDRPCVGIGTLEGLAAGYDGFTAAVIDARRERLFLQCFADGQPLMAPDSLGIEEAAARLVELWSGGPARLVGPAAAMLSGILPGAELHPQAWCDPAALARLAARRPTPAIPPRPLYLRAPDALTIEERAQAAR
jgi:tRNA threonylcarbamoyladenosine biosynthesis protein TsaB